MMIGQTNLLRKLDNISLDSFPRSLILEGESGCGKHTYCNLIANKLNLEIEDITEKLELEYILELRSRISPKIYIVDSSDISIKEQNTILKFVEEPLKNSYIIILKNGKLLPTILNRCQRWQFEAYSKEELSTFNVIDSYNIANTPGQLLKIKGVDLNPIVSLADNIIDRIGRATISNTLSIPNKIALKGEKDKFDFQLFNKILLSRITHRILSNNEIKYIEMYKIISNYLDNCSVPRVDYKNVLDNFLIALWEVAHGFEKTQE